VTAVPSCNLAAVWARRLAGVDTRVLISERTAPSKMLSKSGNWRARFLPSLMHRTYQQADVIVSVSGALGDDLAAVTGIPRQRIVTIYNPVVGPQLAELAAEPVQHPWFQAGEPPVVLSVGRLSPQKDLPTLVRAFARLRQTREARLVVLGGATANGKTELRQTDLAALAENLGIEPEVALLGFVDNPYAYMAKAQVLALSSAWEGFGNVLVEAMACGCPVVSTDCPNGPAEILAGGRFGPLVPVGDAPRLAAALDAVLAHPPKAAMLKQRADDFTVGRSVDAYLRALFGQA
jgi:glycosyltransferase involved in cell wall biosynthesis